MTKADVESAFTCMTEVMVRSPIRTWATVDIAPQTAPSDTDPFPVAALTDFLCGLAEPELDECLAVSSPSLVRTLDAVRAGKRVKDAALRRAALAAARYQLRGASRATPFGLLSGVAIARLGERTDIRAGTAHRKAVSPDAAWLTLVLAAWERRPEVLAVLRLVTNNLVTIRGGRAVLSFVPDIADTEPGSAVRERSVRYTSVVRAALRLARRPVHYPELRDAVLAEFPTAPAASVDGLLGRLVELGLLLTDLRPSVHRADPLGHALAILGPKTGKLPEVVGSELAELAAVQTALANYADLPIGAGRAALTALTDRMTALRSHPNPLAVTLGLDISGMVHATVGAELASAATLLCRLNTNTNQDWLSDYHSAFLERYGVDRFVPVLELLDPRCGLGTPESYRKSSGRGDVSRDPDRDEILAALAMEAGPGTEVVLDNAIVARLCPDDLDTPLQPSMDLYAELIATDSAALDHGDFRILLHPFGGSLTAGAMFARFARPLDRTDLLTRILCDRTETDPVLATIIAHPSTPRPLNVMDRGLPAQDYVAIGTFHDPDRPGSTPLDDLVVRADLHQLRIFSRDLRRELRLETHHMVNPRFAPELARFLSDVGRMGQRRPRPWDWGAVAVAPFLPRVRSGRTVLAAAQWRLADPVLTDRGTSWCEWQRQLAVWRMRWQVPAAIRLDAGDQHIRLDLDRDWHRWLLRDHLLTKGRAQLREDTSNLGPVGWLAGPRPLEGVEIVVSLYANSAHRERIKARPTAAQFATATQRPQRHLPGGSWLYAKLYLNAEHQDKFIAGPLADLVNRLPSGVDRWFFIRYADPEPHLRLRIHGKPAVLTGKVLTDLHDWAAELTSSAQLRDLQLASYEPEIHRYGGPDAMMAAEAVFHADSLAVVAQLGSRAARSDAPRFLLPAANMVDIARHLLAGVPGRTLNHWVLAHIGKSEDDHRAFREHRATALRFITEQVLDPPGPRDTPPPNLPMPEDVWRHRAAALSTYGGVLYQLETQQQPHDLVDTALTALLHMHHNRLAGTDRDNEHRTMATLRGAIAIHDAHRRAVRR